ncbi:unnamed protein product [Phytophthora lilii]|uniref:Unnamed protein product n=1 Tax=Phytophthora lilii TaxID=2077276 RepID=A0A9W6WPD6_9STRA|nr:unnamed protein product [Phytophthora lilii]
MRKAQLVDVVRSLLPRDIPWPDSQCDSRLKDGKTVLMLVTKVEDYRLALKLIDFVCPLTMYFWARDSRGRHVIMDACDHGVHPAVLRRLIKWARKYSLKVVAPMSSQDKLGLDAVELAIRGGHGELVSCLLEQRNPASYDHLLCVHSPLKVLELAIESGNESCVETILTNKRVVNDLQPGRVERLNLIARWTQRQTPTKRLYNLFTCVGAAVRCSMVRVVETIYRLNPEETHKAVWYAVNKLTSQPCPSSPRGVSVEFRQMANSYLPDKLWPELSVIVLVRHWEVLSRNESRRSRIRCLWRRGRRDWEAIAAHPWTTLPTEIMRMILNFLIPSKTSEMKKMMFLAEF